MNTDQHMKKVLETAMPLEALQDPKTQSWLEQADIVWGFDVANENQPSLFFGKERMEQCIKDNQPLDAKVMSFLFDSRNGSLEFLVAAVLTLKGRHCYNT